MALPQKVIEQLGRSPTLTPGWSSRLLMFASTLFFLMLAIYFGIVYGYQGYMDGQLQQVEGQISRLSREVKPEQQQIIVGFYSQLSNLKKIMDEHTPASRIFRWLEDNTNVAVAYDSFGYNRAARQLLITGKATTLNDFVLQARRLENHPDVAHVHFRSVGVNDKGLWQFDLEVLFKPSFFVDEVIAPSPSSDGAPDNFVPDL